MEGWVCDRIHLRSPSIVFNCVLASIGLYMMTWVEISGVQYVGAIFVTAGSSANIPAVMVYQANNVRGPWKRAFCNASLTTLGGVGGIVGALIFREQDAPRYLYGIIGCLA
jgi:MFS family permease